MSAQSPLPAQEGAEARSVADRPPGKYKIQRREARPKEPETRQSPAADGADVPSEKADRRARAPEPVGSRLRGGCKCHRGDASLQCGICYRYHEVIRDRAIRLDHDRTAFALGGVECRA